MDKDERGGGGRDATDGALLVVGLAFAWVAFVVDWTLAEEVLAIVLKIRKPGTVENRFTVLRSERFARNVGLRDIFLGKIGSGQPVRCREREDSFSEEVSRVYRALKIRRLSVDTRGAVVEKLRQPRSPTSVLLPAHSNQVAMDSVTSSVPSNSQGGQGESQAVNFRTRPRKGTPHRSPLR